MRVPPKIDRTTIGISFVDILFALVVGQVLDPVAKWAIDPVKYSLSSATFLNLAVALMLTITSWIGYHNSANRARFTLRFVNVELVKFSLDIAMVVLYFVLAAYAVRLPLNLRPETLLVFVAFCFYFLWDMAGAWQKRNTPNNAYPRVWEEVRSDPNRLDVLEDWEPTDWRRIRVTIYGLIATASVLAIVRFGFSHAVVTPETATVLDVVLLAILLLYRVLKDRDKCPSAEPTRTVMPINLERQSRAAALIPKEPALAQSIFKVATCLAYALGESIDQAVELGTNQALQDDAYFVPVYDPKLLDLAD
jgi:uncharacterized membrane protein